MRNACHVAILNVAGAIAMNISTVKDAVRKHMIFLVSMVASYVMTGSTENLISCRLVLKAS